MKCSAAVLGIALAAVSFFSGTPDARADGPGVDFDAIVADIASENFRRLRRGVVIGPRLGVGGVYGGKPAQPDAELAGGLALYRLSVPFTFEVYKTVVDRTKSLLRTRIAELATEGKSLSFDEVKALALQLYHEVENELLGRQGRRDRTFEKPLWGFSVEGAYQPRAGTGVVRVNPSIGVWHLVAGITGAVHIKERSTALLGVEVAVRGLAGPGPRPNVFEVFLRAEAPFLRRQENGAQLALGGRMTFDLL